MFHAEVVIPIKNYCCTEDIIKNFFDKFLINAEGSATNDNVNVVLLMRAMPNKVIALTLS